jgi:hypothetical protein
MKEASDRVHPVLAGLVIVLCLAATSLMFMIPSDSLAVDLVYQTF